MNSSIDALATLRGFVQLGGASFEDIAAAENELCVVFAEEYSEYLATYGVVSCNGHELTGICQSPRLNVVEVTKAERDRGYKEGPSWYVVEYGGVDNTVVWQSSEGKIYLTAPGIEPRKLADSLVEYVKG